MSHLNDPSDSVTPNPPSVSMEAAARSRLDCSRHQQEFNHDLLLDPLDLIHAKSAYPTIFPVLDFPQFREEFSTWNQYTDNAKKLTRNLGTLAVCLAAMALMSEIVHPLLVSENQPASMHARIFHLVSVILEIGGLVGFLISIGLLKFGSKRVEWLQGRLMTEQLRQWFFQMLLMRGKEIEAACDPAKPDAKAEFEKMRNLWLGDFLNGRRGDLPAMMSRLFGPSGRHGWILHSRPTTYHLLDGPVLNEIFKAYSELRFRRQVLYAATQVSPVTGKSVFELLAWPPVLLLEAFEAVSSFCTIGGMVLVTLGVIGYLCSIPILTESWVPVSVVILTMANVVLKTLVEGMAMREDVERYREYFDSTNPPRSLIPE